MPSSQLRGWVIFLFLGIIALPALAEPSLGGAELLPVPKPLEQGKVDRALRLKYKSEFASHDAAERGALARTLREGADAETDPAAKFVMLREARELSVDAGDFPYSMDVIDDMAKTFAINAEEMKASAIAAGVDKSLLPPRETAQSYLKVANGALEIWNLDLAHKAAYLAMKVGTGNKDLLDQAKEIDKAAHVRGNELLKVIAAERKLARTPDDPETNQIVGLHLCFNTNHWDTGLPYLAKSADLHLKDMAQRDLANPADATAMADLADAWWDFTDSKADVPAGAGRRRAAHWYAKALPGLSGVAKVKADQRIAEMKGS